MACGACEPKAFREGDGVVYGYCVGREPTDIAHETRKLMFLGAEHVFADLPYGNVRYRRGLVRLRKVMRCGDKLILAAESALGTKPHLAERHIAALEAQGVQVAILRPDYFEDHGP